MMGMGLEFIWRSLRTTGLVLLVWFAFASYYFGWVPAVSAFVGGVWGMLNLMFITQLVRVALRPEGADVRRTIGFALIKFPLLYGAGAALLLTAVFDPLWLVGGSTAPLVILVLKAAGRLVSESLTSEAKAVA